LNVLNVRVKLKLIGQGFARPQSNGHVGRTSVSHPFQLKMANLGYKQFTRRHRPHIHPPGAVLFITYRLAGSVPKSTVRDYKTKKEWLARGLVRDNEALELNEWLERIEKFNRDWFMKFEEILHQAKVGPMWMRDERVAQAVADSLRELDEKAYRLDAYSVMSNHVHTIFKPFVSENNIREMKDEDGRPFFISDYPSLSRIMHSVKGRSARECNLILSRSGSFWEHESFDHVIRPGKFDKTLRYVLNNPVKAGLAKHWRDWPWNYCRKELSDKL
jgi:REP element-mobilizing transposase RayT